ncbi:hypothetical protein [Cryobacterium sp. PAMC25264]|nr:hypothetical protein [Cryobacterium sp. PAMC25264]
MGRKDADADESVDRIASAADLGNRRGFDEAAQMRPIRRATS